MIGQGSPAPRVLVAAAVATLSLSAGCARQEAPQGGDPDLIAPIVVGTRPEAGTRTQRLGEGVRVQFSERISERPRSGVLDRAVIVSPRTGEVRVRHRGDALEVDLSGGLRQGLVYRVTVLPVFRDLFGNTMEEPYEFVFSTGGELVPNALAGVILDRVTGEPVDEAEVELRRVAPGGDTIPDGEVHVARADDDGIYAFRYLPAGRYEMLAYTDRDLDLEVDPFEMQGRRRVVIETGDTLLADLALLVPDTTPAVLAPVELEESDVLLLEFDDPVEPSFDPSDVRVTVRPVADTVQLESPVEVQRVLHPWGYERWADSVEAAAEDPDAVPDPPQPRAPVTEGVVPQAPGRERGGLPPGPLPSRELFVPLTRDLPVGMPFEVRVEGVLNVNGLPGGGGVREVVREPPDEPADTVRIPAAPTEGPGAGDA